MVLGGGAVRCPCILAALYLDTILVVDLERDDELDLRGSRGGFVWCIRVRCCFVECIRARFCFVGVFGRGFVSRIRLVNSGEVLFRIRARSCFGL